MGANAAVIAACVFFFQVDSSSAGDPGIVNPRANAQVAPAAERLVQDALVAELAGDNLRRETLLAMRCGKTPVAVPAAGSRDSSNSMGGG